MYLKRLELMGFKSFAQKTVLDFPGGITAVVGPNGSGKSNIIDSVRWILGEREAKNMRSLKAEDLIFAGTPMKPRLGLAQAAIVFDNKNNFFPADFSEVSIRRRLDRSGESGYFINDAEVRLKDIIDFFAKARLGTKGFTIINQGDSDLFVRSTPKERREMLEEILGLRQYQIKKHDAELKLEASRVNMDKVKALIDEITPHLRLLKRQTSKWEKHSELVSELKSLENQYFGLKLTELKQNFKAVEPEIDKVDLGITNLTKELKGLEAELEEIKKGEPQEAENFKKIKKEKEQFYAKKSELVMGLGRLEARIEIMRETVESDYDSKELVRLLEEIRETLQDALYEADLKSVKKLLKGIYDKVDELLEADHEPVKSKEVSAEAIAPDKEKILAKIAEIDKELSSLTELEEKISSGFKDFNIVFRKAYEALAKKKNEISLLEEKKNKLLLEKEKVKIYREELESQARQAGRKLDDFELNVNERGLNAEEISVIERRMLRLRGELASIGEIDEALIKEARETEERHEFLASQLKDLEKSTADLKKLINELNRKIRDDFEKFVKEINEEFSKHFKAMFLGGNARLKIQKEEKEGDEAINNEGAKEEVIPETIEQGGIEIDLNIPRKKIHSLDMLSGGEKSLVSISVLFSLISVSPPPFLVLDEVDAALDEVNSKRFSALIKDFAKKTQFLIVTHNRSTMEAADILYGVTMGDDGVSKVLSLKLE